MHTSTHNDNVSLAQLFQKHLSNSSHKRGILDNVRHKKHSSKQKWTNREYRMQNTEDVENQYVKIYCNKN